MNIDVGIVVSGLTTLLLLLSPDILLVIGEGNVEVESLIALREAESHECVFAPAVLDLEDEVSGRVEDGLDGALAWLARVDEAGGKKIPRRRVLEADLAAGLAGHDAEAPRPDLVGLEPLPTLETPGGRPGRNFIYGDLADDEKGLLQGLLVVLLLLLVIRHRSFGFLPRTEMWVPREVNELGVK